MKVVLEIVFILFVFCICLFFLIARWCNGKMPIPYEEGPDLNTSEGILVIKFLWQMVGGESAGIV